MTWTPIERSTFARHLDDHIWKTKGARFEAARRLSKEALCATYLMALLSVYLVVASVATLVLPMTKEANVAAQLVILFASLVVLVVSIVDAGQNRSLRADRLHQSALELSRLYDRLRWSSEFIKDNDEFAQALDDISARYSHTLVATSENHHKRDYDHFLSQSGNRSRWLKDLEYWSWAYGIYLVGASVPVVIVGIYTFIIL